MFKLFVLFISKGCWLLSVLQHPLLAGDGSVCYNGNTKYSLSISLSTLCIHLYSKPAVCQAWKIW